MISCITINLKHKLSKEKDLKINYFIEKRLNEQNFKDILDELKRKKVTILIIEELIFQNIDNKLEIITYLLNEKIKVILLYFDDIKLSAYFNIKFYNIINMTDINYKNKILELYNKDYEKREVTNLLKEKNTSQNKEDFKEKKNYTILGCSLDRKVFATTFLLNLAYYYSQDYSVNFIENIQSMISVTDLVNFKELDVKYFEFNENIYLFDEKFLSNKLNITIIDIGMVPFEQINKIEYDEMILFLPDVKDKRVLESQKYKTTFKRFDNVKNIQYVQKNNIINKYLEEKEIVFPYKKNKKYIEKNLETVVLEED